MQIAAVMLWIAFTLAGGNDDVTPLIAIDLAQLQRTGTLVIAGEHICAERMVTTFYARRANQPAWNATTTASLLRAIHQATEHGFDPRDYHLAAIESLRGDDPQTIAARDLLCSDAFLLLGLHLTQGRVDPVSLIAEWCITPRQLDLTAALQTALDAEDVEGVLERLAPRHEGYRRLRVALATYRDVQRSGGWPPVSSGPPLLLGDRGPRVLEVRRRLAREPMGVDPPAFPSIDSASDGFDQQLDAAVRHFQTHHALLADGVVGGATGRELNVPAADRVAQIELNMERWRWMPEHLGDSYVLVNIAAFRLDVVENDRSVLSMKTVVGKDFWETPFFPANITEVVLNPSWFVPESIADEELRPKQQRDRSFYAGQHIEVMPGGSLRQLPGPWNALGRIKFNMPNPFRVYLHDTPAKELFSRQTRALSHGCIRLERPIDFALYLLRDQRLWNRDSLDAAIAAGRERVIRLSNPEPVYVLYWTAWVGDDSHVEFHRDVYGRDAGLARALRSPVIARP